jgi:hypothetical protein
MKKTILFVSGMALTSFAHAQFNGTELFDDSYVHRIDVTFTQSDFWDSLTYYYDNAFINGGNVQYMQATVVIDGAEVSSVGVKQKGYYSNWGAMGSLKKPLKIDIAEYIPEQRYDGLKKINLSNGFEDPAMLRDVLAYKFMRDAGIHVPRTAYAKVYLNGTYWGLYIMVEEIDKRALKNWFDDNDGNLYKCVNNTSLAWYGTNPADYLAEFELQTNETTNDWTGFLELVDDINNSGTQFGQNIVQSLNMDNYLSVLAADVIMYNWDSYYYHGRNFFLYENPETERIEWIPWDYNLAFADFPTDLIIDYSIDPLPKRLVQYTQEDAALRSAYFDHVCILADNYFTEANLEPFIDATAALIRPDLMSDPNKFFTISEFDNAIEHDILVTDINGGEWLYKGLKQFIGERQSAIHNQLDNYNHTCTGLGIDESGELTAVLYPNPFEHHFTVKSPEQIERVEVYSSFGQLVKTLYPDQTEAVVSLEACAAGTYIVRVFSSDSVQTLTICKDR